jgi:hypothetical protein
VIVDVLVDAPTRPWQHTIVEMLRAQHELRVHAVSGALGPRSSRAAALYARVDRWPRPVEAGAGEPVEEALAAAAAVVDLTERHVSEGRSPVATVLRPRPARLDEASLLDSLVAGERTLGLEVLDAAGSPVAASTIALARLSARRSSDRAARRLGALLARALAGAGGAERLEGPGRGAPRPASWTGVGALLASAAAAAGRVAVTRPSWRVAVGRTSGEDAFPLPASWRPIEAPSGRWYADPFLVDGDVGEVLFVEDYDVRLGRASIAAIDLQSGRARTVLTAAHHLSYPFVFQADGEWFMVPEESGARRVALYRSTAFPFEWVLDTVLLDAVAAYDATLVRRDGLWWMFLASGPPGTADDDELHVWFAEDVRGPFRPHPLNPVRSSVVGSRPAGRILEHGGLLLRPGQDASREYGGAIVIQRIDRLSTTEYAERTIGRIDGEVVGARGVHTYNRLGDLVAVDTKHSVVKRR